MFFEWDLNGTVFSTQSVTSSGVAQFIDSTLTHGNILTVQPPTFHGLTASDIVAFNINGVPSQPTWELSPDPAYTDDTLSVSVLSALIPRVHR